LLSLSCHRLGNEQPTFQNIVALLVKLDERALSAIEMCAPFEAVKFNCVSRLGAIHTYTTNTRNKSKLLDSDTPAIKHSTLMQLVSESEDCGERGERRPPKIRSYLR